MVGVGDNVDGGDDEGDDVDDGDGEGDDEGDDVDDGDGDAVVDAAGLLDGSGGTPHPADTVNVLNTLTAQLMSQFSTAYQLNAWTQRGKQVL